MGDIKNHIERQLGVVEQMMRWPGRQREASGARRVINNQFEGIKNVPHCRAFNGT